jgi:hypothetical protein
MNYPKLLIGGEMQLKRLAGRGFYMLLYISIARQAPCSLTIAESRIPHQRSGFFYPSD